jgi:hypothetical protein
VFVLKVEVAVMVAPLPASTSAPPTVVWQVNSLMQYAVAEEICAPVIRMRV